MKKLIKDEWVKHRLTIRKYFQSIISTELLNLSEPCYAPKLRKYEDSLFNLLGITKNEVRQEVKLFYKGTKAESWLLENDPINNLNILLMHFFIIHKDMVGFRVCMIFYNLRQYTNLYYKTFKFCQPDIFKFTLENLNKTHIYYREKTIGNAIYHFSNQMIQRWEKEIKKFDDPMKISLFIRECRHRHAQSLKSFATAYYKNSEEGNKISIQSTEIRNDEGDVTTIDPTAKAPKQVINLIQKMTVYKFIDIKALENSLKLNAVNKIYGQLLVKQISQPKYTQDLTTIYMLYISNISSVSSLCSSKFINDVKHILRSKHSKTKYLKQSLNKLLDNIISDSKLEKEFKKLSLQSRYTYLNFLSFYLFWSLKNFVC